MDNIKKSGGCPLFIEAHIKTGNQS